MQGDKRDLYLATDLGDIGAQALGTGKDRDRIFALLNIFFFFHPGSKQIAYSPVVLFTPGVFL